MTLSNPPALNPNLVARVTGIMLQPTAEWRKIRGEATPVKELFTGYVVILAAIGPIAAFLGEQFMPLSFMGVAFKTPLVSGLINALIAYALTVVGVFIAGLIIEAVAPSFNGRKDRDQAMKLAAYSSTPVFLGLGLSILPMLAPVGAIAGAIYSIVLLLKGFPILMKDDAAV